jgi:hemerythrin-like domain-containing protein
LIKEMVDLIDLSVEKLEKGMHISSEAMSKELEFCRDFVSKWHESKEEQVLLPALNKSGYPNDRGPIWETIEDHRKGRSILRRWSTIERATKEEQRLKAFVEYAGAFSMYLFEHVKEEEKGLYRAARLAISAELAEEMTRSAQTFDAELLRKGGRDRYARIVRDLKKELA